MRSGIGKFLVSAIFLGLAVGTSTRPAAAAVLGLMTSVPDGGCSEIVYLCEIVQQYQHCTINVSVAGEVVTASLFTGRHAAHVRLIPMGVGYRYAGRGIWLDGFRENALLNFGKHSQVACSIARS